MLANTSGHPPADQALRAAIALIEGAMPGRVGGYYLVGSYAVGEARPSSDLDLIVLVKGEFRDGERERFAPIRAACNQISAIPLDITLDSEAKFVRVGGVWFQSASVLLYGHDLRPHVPRKPVERHTRDLMHSVLPLLARVRANPDVVSYPLDFPDRAGALRGYDLRYRDEDAARRTATKDLVTNVLAVASALTLLAAGKYVGAGRKSDIPQQYREWVGGEWAALVEDVFAHCRVRWDYRLPAAAADQARLRELCDAALGFENHFLLRYRNFLLAELQAPDTANQLAAARRLGQLSYADPAVAAALRERKYLWGLSS